MESQNEVDFFKDNAYNDIYKFWEWATAEGVPMKALYSISNILTGIDTREDVFNEYFDDADDIEQYYTTHARNRESHPTHDIVKALLGNTDENKTPTKKLSMIFPKLSQKNLSMLTDPKQDITPHDKEDVTPSYRPIKEEPLTFEQDSFPTEIAMASNKKRDNKCSRKVLSKVEEIDEDSLEYEKPIVKIEKQKKIYSKASIKPINIKTPIRKDASSISPPLERKDKKRLYALTFTNSIRIIASTELPKIKSVPQRDLPSSHERRDSEPSNVIKRTIHTSGQRPIKIAKTKLWADIVGRPSQDNLPQNEKVVNPKRIVKKKKKELNIRNRNSINNSDMIARVKPSTAKKDPYSMTWGLNILKNYFNVQCEDAGKTSGAQFRIRKMKKSKKLL